MTKNIVHSAEGQPSVNGQGVVSSEDGTPMRLDAPPDPFDPESLRLPQDFSAALGAKPALVTLKVRKPAKEWFVRVHPSPAYRLQTAFIELKETRELYLVSPHLRHDLAGESTLTIQTLFLAVNRQQEAFFWHLRLPGTDGRSITGPNLLWRRHTWPCTSGCGCPPPRRRRPMTSSMRSMRSIPSGPTTPCGTCSV